MKKYLMISTLFFTVILFQSCGTSKNWSVINSYPPTNTKVEIMNEGQTIPEPNILIGNIVVGDTGFTSAKNCTYAKIIKEATDIAQQMGGNMIYVVSHDPPNFESTCHRINVNVYYIDK